MSVNSEQLQQNREAGAIKRLANDSDDLIVKIVYRSHRQFIY